jgi:nucleoside-diphosphate-sugar epimerase
VCGDVTDIESLKSAVKDSDWVLHLAGVTKSFRARSMRDVNEQGARNIAAACARQANPPVLILVSSLAAAGPSCGDRPRVESEAPQPVSVYGRSKLAGERAATQFCDRVPLTILRPPIVFGEGDPNGLALFRSVARFGVHAVPGAGDSRFSMVHAADLAEAIRIAAHDGQRVAADGTAGIYFATGRETPTFAELGRMIGGVLGKSGVRIFPSPGPVLWTAAAVCELMARVRRQPFILNFDKVREATRGAWHCDGSALYRLGFQPEPLYNRLQQTAIWYRQQGWIPAGKSRRAKVLWRTSREF